MKKPNTGIHSEFGRDLLHTGTIGVVGAGTSYLTSRIINGAEHSGNRQAALLGGGLGLVGDFAALKFNKKLDAGLDKMASENRYLEKISGILSSTLGVIGKYGASGALQSTLVGAGVGAAAGAAAGGPNHRLAGALGGGVLGAGVGRAANLGARHYNASNRVGLGGASKVETAGAGKFGPKIKDNYQGKVMNRPDKVINPEAKPSKNPNARVNDIQDVTFSEKVIPRTRKLLKYNGA